MGFPGETDEEFYKTVEFLNIIKFSKIHVFQYSPREGTRAATMKEQVVSNIKEKRSKILIDISNKYEKEFLEKVDMLADRAFEDQCTTANPRLPLVNELKEILLDSYYGKEI